MDLHQKLTPDVNFLLETDRLCATSKFLVTKKRPLRFKILLSNMTETSRGAKGPKTPQTPETFVAPERAVPRKRIEKARFYKVYLS